jgi:hypothetical protein
MKFVKGALGIAGFIVLIGLGIGTIDPMPNYAVVFLDDTEKKFIALPCIDEWRSRPTKTVDIVKRSTAQQVKPERSAIKQTRNVERLADTVRRGARSPASC